MISSTTRVSFRRFHVVVAVMVVSVCLATLVSSSSTTTLEPTSPPATTTDTVAVDSGADPAVSKAMDNPISGGGPVENDEHHHDKLKDISIIFSDLDGTLIHYPSTMPKRQLGNSLLKLPPSSTGMRGVISSKTLQLIQSLRKRGIKFVLVSGMRTSTFLSRLPYLPRADAYALEAGGRIFYPVATSDDSGEINGDVFLVKPKHFDGASKDDLKPFAIEEDMQWRKNIEQVAGKFDSPSMKELAKNPSKTKDIRERDGLLWDFARILSFKGFVLDTKGYSACFRVNKKQQDPSSVSDDDFNSLTDGRVRVFDGLASSINLSCVDYYPATSGKKNCCLYVASKFFSDNNHKIKDFVSKHAVCLCDDDNDLEMAMACRRAFIPEITSLTLQAAIDAYPTQFTVTARREGNGDDHRSGIDAVEAALSLIWDNLAVESSEKEADYT